jgi:hypothetical protein
MYAHQIAVSLLQMCVLLWSFIVWFEQATMPTRAFARQKRKYIYGDIDAHYTCLCIHLGCVNELCHMRYIIIQLYVMVVHSIV